MVDSTQYEARQSDFDFDLNMIRVILSATTLDGMEISIFADRRKSRALEFPGTKDKALDALIPCGGCSRAPNYRALLALDRILRAAKTMPYLGIWRLSGSRIGISSAPGAGPDGFRSRRSGGSSATRRRRLARGKIWRRVSRGRAAKRASEARPVRRGTTTFCLVPPPHRIGTAG